MDPAVAYAEEQNEWFASQTATLCELFPDADPEFLQIRVAGLHWGVPHMFQALVEELMENRRYPKIEEYRARMKRRETR